MLSIRKSENLRIWRFSKWVNISSPLFEVSEGAQVKSIYSAHSLYTLVASPMCKIKNGHVGCCRKWNICLRRKSPDPDILNMKISGSEDFEVIIWFKNIDILKQNSRLKFFERPYWKLALTEMSAFESSMNHQKRFFIRLIV